MLDVRIRSNITCQALIVCLILAGFLVAAVESGLCQEPSQILFETNGMVLVGSRFGSLPQFQQALSDALKECERPTPSADGKLGGKTRNSILELAHCERQKKAIADSPDGEITIRLWQALLPTVEPPGVLDRSFVLWLSHEGTDYDQVEWNFGTSDDASGLTWGPFGATVGYGNEVRGILAKLFQENPRLLQSAFGTEYHVVRELLDKPAASGYSILRPIFEKNTRRHKWEDIFHQLGKDQEVRNAYDWYAFQSEEWLKPQIRRLYNIISEEPAPPTEIDFAFFVDIAMHMSISNTRVEKAKAALRFESREHQLSPAQRRQVISRALVPSRQPKDRLGRNVVYFVDGVGEVGLSDEERAAWLARSGRKASQCGLSDVRQFLFYALYDNR